MITKELIDRINALSRKQRSVGLTPEEKEEQKKVRAIYLQNIREQLTGLLDQIEIVDTPSVAAKVAEVDVEIKEE